MFKSEEKQFPSTVAISPEHRNIHLCCSKETSLLLMYLFPEHREPCEQAPESAEKAPHLEERGQAGQRQSPEGGKAPHSTYTSEPVLVPLIPSLLVPPGQESKQRERVNLNQDG